MTDLQIQHYFSGREYARRMTLPAGHYAETHRHNFDHLSILASGRVLVTVDGATVEYSAPECIVIRAGQVHRIEAITPAVWFCVHGTTALSLDQINHELIKEN